MRELPKEKEYPLRIVGVAGDKLISYQAEMERYLGWDLKTKKLLWTYDLPIRFSSRDPWTQIQFSDDGGFLYEVNSPKNQSISSIRVFNLQAVEGWK